MKETRKLLTYREILEEEKESRSNNIWFVIMVIAVVLIGGCLTCRPAHAYTDEQYVNAIRKAEGTWTYGIKTVTCKTEKSCKAICLTTIKNNKKRFSRRPGGSKDFVAFLATRYCPIGASNDPSGLNKNWERNVRYFLAKENK